MSSSLKDQNRWPLLGVLLLNYVLYSAIVHRDALMAGNWMTMLTGIAPTLPAAGMLALVGILNSQLSPLAKARIVFLRWNDPYPGGEAFSRIAKADPRIDWKRLSARYGPFPRKRSDQNSMWYRLYAPLKADTAVATAHREFLFARDYACLTLLIGPVLLVAAALQLESRRALGIYAAVLLAQFLLARRAAAGNGERMVATVLASVEL